MLLTKKQFEARFTAFEEPYFEYGVKFLPRRDHIVEQARAALAGAPSCAPPGSTPSSASRTIGPREVAPGVASECEETA